MASEQKIMKVEMNRGACCHVAGDIDFDDDNNLWMVTGDDTPATALGANNYPPSNDYKTNESQTVRVTGATGGTFTLTFEGQTTAPIALNANAAAIQAALEGLDNDRAGRRARHRQRQRLDRTTRRSPSAARTARPDVAQATARRHRRSPAAAPRP